MKTNPPTQPSWPRPVTYGLAYVLWLLTIVMALLAVLQTRVAVSALWVLSGADRYAVALVDQVYLLVIGFAAFVYVMWLEHYYRTGVELRIDPKLSDKIPPLPEGRVMRQVSERGLDLLLRRFAFTFSIPLCLFLLSLVAYQITLNAMTSVS